MHDDSMSMTKKSQPERVPILRINVHAIDRKAATDLIMQRATLHRSECIYVCNVHLCMEAFDDAYLSGAMNKAALVVADGRPIYWMQRLRGATAASQVTGRDLMLSVCQSAAESGVPVGLLGSTPDVIRGLTAQLTTRFPTLKVSYADPSVFRPLTAAEDEELINDIKRSDARILFVGLGCPRQELFISRHLGRIPCVMIGVGAAFDFIAGNKPTAPAWTSKAGLEWLFRLMTEPRRLWRRYLIQNTRFIWHSICMFMR